MVCCKYTYSYLHKDHRLNHTETLILQHRHYTLHQRERVSRYTDVTKLHKARRNSTTDYIKLEATQHCAVVHSGTPFELFSWGRGNPNFVGLVTSSACASQCCKMCA